jgi:hypothetical protein
MKNILKPFIWIFRFFFPKGGYKKAFFDGMTKGAAKGERRRLKYEEMKKKKEELKINKITANKRPMAKR